MMTVDAPVHPDCFQVAMAPEGQVILAGEADIACLDSLRAALDQAMLEAGTVITVDLADVSFIDTAAISEFLRYQLLASPRHQQFCLKNASGEVALALDVLDLRHILTDGSAPTAEPEIVGHWTAR
jgi:anti-anti-sigma factor